MSYLGRQVVVVTAAGRRRYMEVLARYIDGSIVDRWDLWLNVKEDRGDLAWLKSIEGPHVRAVEIQHGPKHGTNYEIRNFYPHAADAETIFCRLDDDIVWLAPDFFAKLLDCRLANLDPLLVSANVVNNAICGHLQQRAGAFGFGAGTVGYNCLDPVGWKDQHHAEYVHRAFLANPNADRWRTQDWILYAGERFSINAICWFGADMAKIIQTGGVGEDEEEWLTYQYPRQSKRPNMICGSAVASHFAFYTQRKHLDATDVLDGYRKLAGLT